METKFFRVQAEFFCNLQGSYRKSYGAALNDLPRS